MLGNESGGFFEKIIPNRAIVQVRSILARPV
jgi:hypothetical protein